MLLEAVHEKPLPGFHQQFLPSGVRLAMYTPGLKAELPWETWVPQLTPSPVPSASMHAALSNVLSVMAA